MLQNQPHARNLSPEFALLGLLVQQPAHGYELHQRLVAELGQVWHVSQSQAYNILSRLEAQGFLCAELETQEKLPSRRRLYLTEAGKARFEAWLRLPSGCSVRAIRVEFTTRLYFAYLLYPHLFFPLLDTQVSGTRAGLAHLQAALAALPTSQTFNRLGLQLRIRQLSSVLDWLQECRLTMESPRHG
jgi:DNA-binding PadR family transcriptional regulator